MASDKQDVTEIISRLILRVLNDHRSEENRISRRDLKLQVSDLLGAAVGDRKLRDIMMTLRFDDPRGAWICGSFKSGYYLARDEDELNAFLRSDEHRARTLLARCAKQRKNAGLQNPAVMRLPLLIEN